MKKNYNSPLIDLTYLASEDVLGLAGNNDGDGLSFGSDNGWEGI